MPYFPPASSGSGTSVDVYKAGSSVVNAATRLDFKDGPNIEASGTQALLYANLPFICQGRLTLETGVPNSSTDQTGKTNIYFTPYGGRLVSVYDGTRWRLVTLSGDLTLAVGTKTSGKNYDVVLDWNSGTPALGFSAAWTDDNTRADALTTQDGVTVMSGATTKRLLGTVRTTSTTTVEDSLVKRFVANLNNRIPRDQRKESVTDNHTYGTATVREWKGDTDVHILEFVTPEVQLFEVGGWTELSGAGYTGVMHTASTDLLNLYVGNTNGGAVRASMHAPKRSLLGYNKMVLKQYAGGSTTFSFYRIETKVEI